MKINVNPYTNNVMVQKKDSYGFSPAFKMPCDTVSFKGYDHLKLEGFDRACASLFKVHLEKFKSKEDFHNWAKLETAKKMDLSKYYSVNEQISNERKETLSQWKSYLTSDDSVVQNPALKLLIFHGITKSLKPDNKEFPAEFNESVLVKTISEIERNLSENKNFTFDLDKRYRHNLKLSVIKEMSCETQNNEMQNGWLKIKSFKNDKENFEDNINKLKNLSSRGWCTKGGDYAKTYLLKGDFHIYFEDGEPRVGVRLEGNKIVKIEGAMNNLSIPACYFDELQKHIANGDFDTSAVTSDMRNAKRVAVEIPKIKSDVAGFLKKGDSLSVLKYLGFNAKDIGGNKFLKMLGIKNHDSNTKLVITNFRQPSMFYSFIDLGIDENELFKHVVKIEADADFSGASLTKLPNLVEVGGNANFEDSLITDVSNLKSIGEDARFTYSTIKDLRSLESVGGELFCTGTVDIDLSGLKSVGKNAWLDSSSHVDVSSLENVGEKLWIDNAKFLEINPKLPEQKTA